MGIVLCVSFFISGLVCLGDIVFSEPSLTLVYFILHCSRLKKDVKMQGSQSSIWAAENVKT